MSSISGNGKKFKKFIPAVFLVALTIALMFYFKENRGDFGELVEKSKDDLLTLYTQNLQPLLFGTDITNEDVFNFALYQTLPIDKKQNKMLRISEENGTTSYQVMPSSYKEGTENYDNFVKYMGFNKTQKAKLDSILESYQPELAEAILTDGKNTVAVSPRLINLQKAILTDIAVFAREVDRPKLSSLLGGKDFAFLDYPRTYEFIEETKKDTAKDYLVITEDTAFTSRLEFNASEFEKQIAALNKEMSSLAKEPVRIKVKAIKPPEAPGVPSVTPLKNKYFTSDTGYSYSYTLPEFNFDSDFDSEEMDSLRITLENLREELSSISFNFDIDSLSKSLKFDMKSLEGDTLRNINFEFNFENLGEIINRSIESATKNEDDEAYWRKFELEIDSLAKEMVKFKKDSVRISEEMRRKLEDLKKLKEKKK